MAKTTPAAPAAAPTPAEPLTLPTTGGCWVRNPDGTLSRDLSEHPEAATAADQPKE
ncbi:MAG: hypothetical protein ACK44A_04915 [Roseateles sp.]